MLHSGKLRAQKLQQLLARPMLAHALFECRPFAQRLLLGCMALATRVRLSALSSSRSGVGVEHAHLIASVSDLSIGVPAAKRSVAVHVTQATAER